MVGGGDECNPYPDRKGGGSVGGGSVCGARVYVVVVVQ